MASFSLSPRAVRALRRGLPPVALDAGAERGPDLVQCQWLARDRVTALGEAFSRELPADAPMEAHLPEGGLGHVMVVPGLHFEAEPPQGAHYLQLESGGGRQVISRRALTATKRAEEVEPELFGPAGARFVFPIFAERYTESESFFAAVKQLYDWICGVPPFRGIAPFNEDAVRQRFALRAYFWPTDPVVGQFNTRDKGYDCDDRPKTAVVFHGSNPLARARLGHLMLEGKYGLVLINSRERGGAGGMAEHRYPAWSSTTSCDNETWQGVALHEIAHGLGLADEYLDEGRDDERWQGEPNAATNGAFAGSSWAGHFTERPPTAASYFTLDQQVLMDERPAVRPDPHFVGMFEGGRYRRDYFRPSYGCLMRWTNWPQLCPVCAAAIRRKI